MNLALVVSQVFAAETGEINIEPKISGIENLEKITVSSAITTGATILLIVAALIFFFMLVIGGIRWATSGGDKEKAAAARGQLTAALIGIAIVLSAWMIINLINYLFGVNLIRQLKIPTLY